MLVGGNQNLRKRQDQGQEGCGEDHQRDQDTQEGSTPKCSAVI